MLRSFLASLAFLILTLPSLVFAADDLAVLESVVAAGEQVQPDLLNYHVTIETTRAEEMMARLAEGSPPAEKVERISQGSAVGFRLRESDREVWVLHNPTGTPARADVASQRASPKKLTLYRSGEEGRMSMPPTRLHAPIPAEGHAVVVVE